MLYELLHSLLRYLFVQSWFKVNLDFIWHFREHVAGEQISCFERLPRVALMCCCECYFPRMPWCQTEVEKSHCDTIICSLPHSAVKPKSRHPSTLAANITTSPPPAARGWGKKQPARDWKHTRDAFINCHLFYSN